MASKLLLSCLIGLATAQTSTIDVAFIGWDATPLVASVVGVSPTATTLALACVEGTDANDCGLFPKQILVVGPSTYNMDMSDPNTDFTATEDCAIGATTIVCKESAGGSEANFPGSSTETYEATSLTTLPVTITAGQEKLTATGSASQSAGAASRSAVSTAGASATSSAGSSRVSGFASTSSSRTASQTGSASASASAAAANIVTLGGGVIGAAAGLVGGLMFL